MLEVNTLRSTLFVHYWLHRFFEWCCWCSIIRISDIVAKKSTGENCPRKEKYSTSIEQKQKPKQQSQKKMQEKPKCWQSFKEFASILHKLSKIQWYKFPVYFGNLSLLNMCASKKLVNHGLSPRSVDVDSLRLLGGCSSWRSTSTYRCATAAASGSWGWRRRRRRR